MPTGYPDYFGQPGFSKLGAAQELQDDDSVNGNTTKTMFSITGQGTIYGGYIWIMDADNTGANDMIIFVNDTRMFLADVFKQHSRALFKGVPLPIFMFYWDPDANKFGYGISPGITFLEIFRIDYINRDANEVEYFFHCAFALVS